MFFELKDRKKYQIEEYAFFANDFIIYLFQLINSTFQIEQITAISKLKSKQKILEYYIVTLCIKIMKEFKALFGNCIKIKNQHLLEFRDIGLKIGKIKTYAQEIDSELHKIMGDEGGVMKRLNKLARAKASYEKGILCFTCWVLMYLLF
jgi:hypothetical protein